ncbi:MAG: oxidoreductase [Halobacteriovoraceae bacterium]|nr:oxidoreductase [Halobacteriovoraceae bacterium]|tara:strand:+ start:12396 stop:13109 length:714 start_codon:yes stop_codon:yes gene_type:complete
MIKDSKDLCIIGGAKGLIGQNLLHNFAAKGYRAIGLDMKCANSHNSFELDLTDESHVKEVMEKIFRQDLYETVTLINTQGIADPYHDPIEDLSLKKWQEYFNTNVTSYFLLAKEMVKHQKSYTKGSIINLSSTRSFMAEKNTEAYCMTKGAITSFTKALAMSCDKGKIRVNSISPGWIAETEHDFSEDQVNQHPVNLIGEPEDIFHLCYFLSLPASKFITGQDFIVDGGMTSKMIYK